MAPPRGTELVGRAEPRHRLVQAALASEAGRRSAVLVSGVAGIGKTSLIRAAIDDATDDTTLVGWGTCWHGEGAPGFWPWMQAMDDLVRAVGRDAAVAAAGLHGEFLATVVRDLGPVRDTTDDPDRQRLLLLDAVVRWLETLAEHQHVVIVLDDLQWADSSTLDLLDHVVAAPVRARLLVVGAFRHDELDSTGQARLATLASHTDRIHLEGLALADVEELVASISGPEVAATVAGDLYARTGGHPLFVSELARLPGSGSEGPLPTAVAGAVARRLDTLPRDSRIVLDAASVLGNRLLPDVLGEVADLSSAAVLEHLASCVQAGLVRTGPGDELWFTHDLFRETLYARLGVADRARLHGRVGHALEGRLGRGASVPPGDLARHFTQAIAVDDPGTAIHWAREAARDEGRRAAFAEAAAHLRRVRTASADAGYAVDPDVLSQMLMDEADHQARSGDPDVARTLLEQAARSAPGPEREADVALAVQRLGAKFSAPRDRIVAQLESALASVTGHDLPRQARVTAALARELQHSVAEDRHRALPLSEKALALGRESGDDDALAACLLARHDALWGPGTGRERAALGHEIATVAARLGDSDRLAEGLLLEANGLLESGSAGFRPVLDRWFGLLDSRGERRDRYMLLTRRTALSLLDGDADEAHSAMTAAARLGKEIHEPDTGNVLMSQRVALARITDDPDGLRCLATDAVRWWTGAPVLAHAVAAGAHAAAGDLDEAAREVAMVAEAGGWRSEGSYLRSVLVGHLAEAATALHDLDLCAALLDDVKPLSDSCGVNGAVVAFAGPFAHAAGILAAELGDAEYARLMLEQSVESAQRIGAAVWVRLGENALHDLDAARASAADSAEARDVAELTRSAGLWTVSWRGEEATLPHVKGLADLAVLVTRPGQDVSALRLVGGLPGTTGSDEMVDLTALRAYRARLDELDTELDQAGSDNDAGRVERLEQERRQLLAELRRVTGLGGRIRHSANDPAERARKAVSGRIRDAIRRLEEVAPLMARHLDRSVRTGLQCSYTPGGDDGPTRWQVRG